MMIYDSKSRFESKLCPGVVYTIRKMSQKRRMKLNSSASEIFEDIDNIQSKISPIQEEIDRAESAAKLEPCACPHDQVVEKEGDPPQHDPITGRCRVPGCKCREPQPDSEIGGYKERLKFQSQILEVVVTKLYPAYIRWAVEDIQGLNIDGIPATVDSLIDDGPEALITELGEEIQRMIKLSPEEVMAFQLPTTSGGQVVGQTSDTTAPSVNPKKTTEDATAVSTSQS